MLLLLHIKENSKTKEIFLDTLNCIEDHIHLLISLGTEQTIAKIAMLIKGESSSWVNKQKLIKQNLNGRMNILLCQLANLLLIK